MYYFIQQYFFFSSEIAVSVNNIVFYVTYGGLNAD